MGLALFRRTGRNLAAGEKKSRFVVFLAAEDKHEEFIIRIAGGVQYVLPVDVNASVLILDEFDLHNAQPGRLAIEEIALLDLALNEIVRPVDVHRTLQHPEPFEQEGFGARLTNR